MSSNTENQRTNANFIREGRISAVDLISSDNLLVRVKTGDLETTWLKYFAPACGGVRVHRPPSIGEFCLIFSPSGVLENGYVLTGLTSSAFPSPSNSPDVTMVEFPDGAAIEYNHKDSSYKMTGVQTVVIESGTSVKVNSPKTTFTGEVIVQKLLTYQSGLSGSNGDGGKTTITGDMQHVGTLENTGKMSSNGVVVDAHNHPDAHGGNTGEPNK